MLINELPVEIISQILLNVTSKNDIYECAKVCQLWHREMVPVYYKDTTIHPNHQQFLCEVSTKIDDNGHRIGDYVKSLRFGRQIESVLSRENFEFLIYTLPSLQVIRMDHIGISKIIEYMECLDEIALRTKLQEVSINGYFSNGTEINKKLTRLYYSINNQLKHQITTLTLFETTVKFQPGSDSNDQSYPGSQEILDCIKGFDKLKHLTLSNTAAIRDLSVASVLDACCDTLHSLKYKLRWKCSTTGDHKYHFNLITLTLSLTYFDENLFGHLVKYVPNLKELDIIFSGELFTHMCTSMQPGTYCKFKRYLKQLQSFKCWSSKDELSNDNDIFWQSVRQIYNNQNFCNLQIQFYVEGSYFDDYMEERICFDKQTFDVECKFALDQFDVIAQSFDFLSLNSIQISYSKQEPEEESYVEDDRNLSDLLTFATSQRQVQVYLIMESERLILCTKPVVTYKQFIFPQDRSPIQYAFLENVLLNIDLLHNISTHYPTIEEIKLMKCEIPTQDEDTNRYIIDLRQFKYLQELVFDLNRAQTIVQWNNGDDENKHYCYDYSVSGTAIFSTKFIERITKDTCVIMIKTFRLQRLIFQRDNRNLQVINA